MKDKKKIVLFFAAIALLASVGMGLVSCRRNNAPNGTYNLNALESWTITFGQGTYSMFIPAEVAPTGTNTTATGSFTVSGKTLTINDLGQTMTFTIDNATTLTESDGSVWKKR